MQIHNDIALCLLQWSTMGAKEKREAKSSWEESFLKEGMFALRLEQ